MPTAATAETLISWAVAEGFDRAGIAPLRPSEHADAFRAWLERGDHAGLEYLERRSGERLDPRSLFHEARSALCVAQQYHPAGAEIADPDGALAHVARYARGSDYHDVMKQRLERLAGRIRKAFPGALTRSYVDTGPVLERELAARAGIGSFGKNTNLLHPEAGSWFFLGEIFLTLELDSDATVAELCGSCTRCLEACPTGALPEPYRLDANRCISFWTIEHRGWLPEEVRPMIGEWLFGCDICQEVCPVNGGGDLPAAPEFAPDGRRAALSLADLLGLSRDDYVETFRGSPMKRAKLEGLQRNAAVVLGNLGKQEAIPALAGALGHPDPMVRGHAAWALGQLGGSEAARALGVALATESEDRVRDEIEAALTAG
jgi:epoxyqueuosine reductase